MEEFNELQETQEAQSTHETQGSQKNDPDSVPARLRRLLSSGQVLAMIICLAVGILFTPMGSSAKMNHVADVERSLWDSLGMADYLDASTYNAIISNTGSSASASVGSIFGCLPMILTGVGFLLIYLSARNKNEDMIPSTGFSMLKVMNIIGIVGYSFVALFCVILCLLMTSMGFLTGDSGVGVLILIISLITFVIAGGITALMIAKNAGLNSSIDSIKAEVNGTPSRKKVSGFSIVMLYIIGSLSAISFFGSLSYANFSGALASGAQGAYFILLGINLGSAKNIING